MVRYLQSLGQAKPTSEREPRLHRLKSEYKRSHSGHTEISRQLLKREPRSSDCRLFL